MSLYPPEHQAEIAATLALESEPVTRVLQENAYREVLLRQLINDKARGLLLAYARGTTLEHIAALFDVERLVVTAADPEHGIDAVYEDEDSLRERVQLAPRGFSVAGPEDMRSARRCASSPARIAAWRSRKPASAPRSSRRTCGASAWKSRSTACTRRCASPACKRCCSTRPPAACP
nr:hypothetical protein [Burkholderia pseudomallei]